jgi:hypothetical protein
MIDVMLSRSPSPPMEQDLARTMLLPPELWIYIHRLAVSDISPLANVYMQDEVVKYSGAPDHPLNDQELQRFLKVHPVHFSG